MKKTSPERVKALRIGTKVKHGMCGGPVVIRACRIVWLGWCPTCKEEVRYEAMATQ